LNQKGTSDSELAKQLGSEILIAELGETAFESFTETETEFLLLFKGLMGRNNLGEHPNITI
jgi:hypothetical protein